ncbi:MAG: hypothetical protein AAF747_09335, partial [Planctomycetota bacterium]
PMRDGHAHWLADDIAALDEPGVFAVTNAHLVDELEPERPEPARLAQYKRSDFASLNFSLMKASAFGDAMRFSIGQFIDQGFRGEFPSHIECEEKYRRALIEWGWQHYCREQGLTTLVRPESLSWMIYHINKRDRKLLEYRRRFRKRLGVEKYFDTPRSLYRPPHTGLGKFGRRIENAVRTIRRSIAKK